MAGRAADRPERGCGIEIHPASDAPPPSIFENYHERIAQLRGDKPTG
jgi:hypothetical protein